MLRIKTIKRWERNFNQWYSDKCACVCVRVWLQNEFIKMNVCSHLAIIFYSFIVKYEVKLKQISHSTESNYRLHICFGKTIVMLLHLKRFQRRGERICTLSSWFRCSKPHVCLCSFRYFIRFFAKSIAMCEWMFIWWWGREREIMRDGEHFPLHFYHRDVSYDTVSSIFFSTKNGSWNFNRFLCESTSQ